MNFLTPIYFILSIFIIGVILFYLFRKQYESNIVPSTLMWQQVMQEWQATKWWKKLQNHLLLYLQLIILLLVMFALTRPYVGLNELSGEHIVVVLDTSASMTATEEDNKSRLSIAKNEIMELVDKLDNQMLTLVLAQEIPTIIFSNETTKQTMKSKIEGIKPSYQQSDMDKAIQLANQLLARTSGEIHVFSDRLREDQINTNYLSSKLVVHNIGDSTNNLSLHTFGVAENNGKISGIVSIYNELEEEQLARVKIESGKEKLYSFQELIEPGKLVQFSIPELPAKSYYKAVITNEDDYEADNTTFSFLGQVNNPPINLIGEVNPFTRKALSYFSTDIVQYEQDTNVVDNHGIYVLEGVPEKEWPDGPAIIFSPTEGGHFNVREKQLVEHSLQVNNNESILRYVDLNQVYIQSRIPYDALELDTLLSSNHIPIISNGYYNGNPIILVGIDIADTDWPMHSSFPIFLYNAINYLNKTQETLGFIKPLERINIAHDPGATTSQIVTEQKEQVMALNLDESFFQAPSLPGLYSIIEESNGVKSEKLFAVSISTEEKYIHPKSSFSLDFTNDGSTATEEKPNELWPWLVLLALLVLFLEWEVYRRGNSN
ncbi:vWA domain-containing protein [Paucisalibacillus globulus]|uniref:vWA domain-containing protein n=1 Tax=Paucisalibacillus globulus TaxID=351095 RepID=UPI000A025CF0|nr:BatA and WFA domain-containing protein [Paucisalibacillus globulus]